MDRGLQDFWGTERPGFLDTDFYSMMGWFGVGNHDLGELKFSLCVGYILLSYIAEQRSDRIILGNVFLCLICRM